MYFNDIYRTNGTLTNSTAFDAQQPGIVDIGAYEFRGSTLDVTPPVLLATDPLEIDSELERVGTLDSIVLTFSEAINSNDANASANYNLISAGVNGVFGDGDDVIVSLLPNYTTGSQLVTLGIVGSTLSPGQYRLTVVSNDVTNSGLHDLAGILFDGDDNAIAGGDYVREFSLVQPDLDSDGDVDGADFLAWQRGFGKTSGASVADGDTNGDEAVNDLDLSVWQQNYGTTGLAALSSSLSAIEIAISLEVTNPEEMLQTDSLQSELSSKNVATSKTTSETTQLELPSAIAESIFLPNEAAVLADIYESLSPYTVTTQTRFAERRIFSTEFTGKQTMAFHQTVDEVLGNKDLFAASVYDDDLAHELTRHYKAMLDIHEDPLAIAWDNWE